MNFETAGANGPETPFSAFVVMYTILARILYLFKITSVNKVKKMLK